jgi:NADPH2:quinone reductase
MLVNPMTAMAFIQIAREGKHRAMVNNAAASALGKMLIRLAKSQGIPLINIVRKEEHVTLLMELGAKHVLNSNSESFAEELRRLSKELEATLLLDAVTGSQSAILLDAAPRGSTLLGYARLSGDPMTADAGALIREEKRIVGFQLGNWLQTKGLLFKIRFINGVKKQLDGDLSSQINRTYPLESIEEAILHYRAHMSEGKIVLNIGS